MTSRAKASKAVGSVIDGRFRDLQEQRGLGFPVRSPKFSPSDENSDGKRSLLAMLARRHLPSFSKSLPLMCPSSCRRMSRT